MKEGWEIKELQDCLSYIKNGANIKQTKGASGIPITRIETLSGGQFHRDKLGYADVFELGKFAPYVLDDADILMSHINSKAYIGRSVIYHKQDNEQIIHGMNLLRLKFFPDAINPEFANYYFKCDFFLGEVAKIRKDAVNQSSMAISDLKKISIPVPPLSEQQHIVEELDLLSSIIEKKKAQLNELDNLAQSLFYEMFGDPISNEKGWEVKKMGEVCNVTSSKRIFASEYCCNGVPFYRGKEITEKSKGQEISVELYISTERYEEIKKEFGIPIKGDVLITAVGTIGNIWVVNDEEPFYFKDGNIIWLKDIKGINSVYFKTILSILIAAYKQQMAQGCAYNALTIVNLKKMFFALPPIDLQNLFASKIEAIEHQKELTKESIKEVETLFNSRMDYYFN